MMLPKLHPTVTMVFIMLLRKVTPTYELLRLLVFFLEDYRESNHKVVIDDTSH